VGGVLVADVVVVAATVVVRSVFTSIVVARAVLSGVVVAVALVVIIFDNRDVSVKAEAASCVLVAFPAVFVCSVFKPIPVMRPENSGCVVAASSVVVMSEVTTNVVAVADVTSVFPSVVVKWSVTACVILVSLSLVVFSVFISGSVALKVLTGVVVVAGVEDVSPVVISVVVRCAVISGLVAMASLIVVIFVVSDCFVEV